MLVAPSRAPRPDAGHIFSRKKNSRIFARGDGTTATTPNDDERGSVVVGEAITHHGDDDDGALGRVEGTAPPTLDEGLAATATASATGTS